MGQQQRDIIHTFGGDAHWLFHADSLPESLDRVHIYANRELLQIFISFFIHDHDEIW